MSPRVRSQGEGSHGVERWKVKKVLLLIAMLCWLTTPAMGGGVASVHASVARQTTSGVCTSGDYDGTTNCVIVPHNGDFVLAVFNTGIVLGSVGNTQFAGTEIDVTAVASPCPGAQTEGFTVSASGPFPPLSLQTAGTLYRFTGTGCVPVNSVLGAGTYEVFPPQDYTVSAIIDGHTDVGWESAPGQTTNQRVIVSLGSGRSWRLTDILIDPEATAGDTSDSDLRHFRILASTTGTADADFHTVLTGTTQQQTGLQHFPITGDVQARYVELVGIDNYGGRRLAVSEFEVYGRPSGASLHLRQHVAVRDAPHAGKKPKGLARVRWINKGLTVRAPLHKPVKGKVRQTLYARYALQTLKQQKASFTFIDGSTVHMAQLTRLNLRDPHVTVVTSGQIDERVQPGTNHNVRTATAVASAVGTNFIVRINKRTTIVIVIEGSVSVKNTQGSQIVKTNQESTVAPNEPPSIPRPVNASSESNWTQGIPAAPLSVNVALDTNGGEIVSSS
jgi:hypothetical protein